ncbi:MAG: o-succinylbenzoate synthase [bacterium]|nr:o-succinylbenzoate synthase [bacterium]
MTALRAELHPFRLALKAPLVTGGVSIRFRAGFLVALSADGITGWGEASPLPGWSRTSLLDTETALRSVSDDLVRGGEAVLDTLLAAMHDTPHARAGVAGAWADLQARRSEQPLAGRLVAGSICAPASEVAVNALIAAPEPSEVEQAAHDAVEAGFKAVKLKVGAVDPEVDAGRIRAARAGLGPAAELRLDANGAWDEHTALNVLGRVYDCGIAYCEEPVAGIDAIAAVSRRSPIPVAADESIRGESDAGRALDVGVSTLIVKPQALGGPDVALSIAGRAHQVGASVTVTSFLDSAVGVAHALHVAAAVDAIAPHRRAHGLATAGLLSADVADLPPVTAGVMSLPPGYGIGVAPAL